MNNITERKGSKGSITNTDEIISNDTQIVSTPKITTTIVHKENEKTGETTDVSDRSK